MKRFMDSHRPAHVWLVIEVIFVFENTISEEKVWGDNKG